MKRLLIIFISVMFLAAGTAASSQQKDAATKASGELSEAEAEKLAQQWDARERSVRRAMQLSEPRQRIKALEKLQIDFPNDPSIHTTVSEGILETYIKFWPQRHGEILARIDKLLRPLPEDYRVGSGTNIFNKIATQLVDAGVLLSKAEELALKGIAAFDEREFIKRQKRNADLRREMLKKNQDAAPALKTDPISDEDLARMIPAERAKALTTLGRVYLKQGKIVEAEKTLKEAYDANPDIPEASIALSEISLKAGNDTEVIEYLSAVAVRSPLKPELRQRLEIVYRKTHKGSLAGLEELLDAKYRALMPNPVKVEHYKPTPGRTDRVVLAEVFTGAGCVPCVGADLAFEAAMERYSDKNVVILMYHLHRPLPDPMVNPSALMRANFYRVERTPSFVIDGQKDEKGGAIREKTRIVYDRIEPVIEKRLEVEPGATIKVEAGHAGSTVKIRAVVDKVKSESRNLKLQIALVENELRYSGENLVRIHPMVVRSFAGVALKPSGPTVVEHTFDLLKISAEIKTYLENYEVSGDYGPISFKEKKDKVDGQNLSIVAFVQDETSKQVLQATHLKVKSMFTMAEK